MSDSNGQNPVGQKPVGYGHDQKGAAGGANYGDGKPGVAHTAPADKIRRQGRRPHGENLHHRRPRDRHPRGRDDFPRRAPARYQAAASVLHAEARLPARRQLPRLHGRDRGRAGAGRKLHPQSCAGHEGQDPDRPRQDRAQNGRRTVGHRPARDGGGARSGFRALEDRDAAQNRARPFPEAEVRRGARARPQPCGDGGQSRRLHPVQSLRPRLPRGPGQRRHRHGRPRPSREDRVRLRRSDGRLDLRRLRRMRAGLPDRRADAGHHGGREQRLQRQARPHRRQRLPLLRRRLPTHLSDQGRQDCFGGRQKRSSQSEPALRQRPLRLRLRGPSAAAVEADDPQGRRAESAARIYRSVQSLDAFPRGDMGRGARPCGGGLEENPRPRRAACARRFRLRQRLERGSLSVPETGAHRLRHQQRRSLHPAVPRLVGGGALGRRRLGGGDRDLQRMQEFRPHHRHRRQSDREPSGRRDLLQAGGQARREARGDGPARSGAQAPCLAHAAVQERRRRGDA